MDRTSAETNKYDYEDLVCSMSKALGGAHLYRAGKIHPSVREGPAGVALALGKLPIRG